MYLCSYILSHFYCLDGFIGFIKLYKINSYIATYVGLWLPFITIISFKYNRIAISSVSKIVVIFLLVTLGSHGFPCQTLPLRKWWCILCMHSYQPLSILVPNSRDRHEKNGYQILCSKKHTLNYVLFEKSRLKCISNAINNIALISTK